MTHALKALGLTSLEDVGIESRGKGALEAKVLKDSLSVDKLLHNHTGSSQHSQAAVVDLLGLHLSEGLGILGFEAQGIEAKVSVDVTRSELRSGLVVGVTSLLLLHCLPSVANVVALNEGNQANDEGGETKASEGIGLLELVDGGANDLVTVEGSAELDLLTNDDAQGCKHGKASVLELALTPLDNFTLRGLFREASGVEES